MFYTKREITLLLSALLLCIGIKAANQGDKKYFGGAVPEIAGKIIFKKNIPIEGSKSRELLYNNILSWITKESQKTDEDLVNTLLYANSETGELVARLETKLIFRNEGIILDDAIMQCVLKIKIDKGYLGVEVQNIRYDYFESEFNKDQKVKGRWAYAENVISDAASMNKEQTRLYKPYDKFRRFTIDQVNNIYSQIQSCIKDDSNYETYRELKNDKVDIISTSVISENNETELMLGNKNVLIIAGDKDGFCVATPISYSLEKLLDNTLQIYIELEDGSCVSKMIETGVYSIITYQDSYEPLLTSMSDQKKFTVETFRKLGLTPVELSTGNISLDNAKISMTVVADPKETDIARNNKERVSSNIIFIGKVNLSDVNNIDLKYYY